MPDAENPRRGSLFRNKILVTCVLICASFAAVAGGGELIWKADFAKDAAWTNRSDLSPKTDFVFTNDAIVVTGHGKMRDTAFLLTSERMPYARRGKYVFEYALEGNFASKRQPGFGWCGNGSPSWSSGIRWYDAQGEVLTHQALPVVFRAGHKVAFRVVDVVPPEAVAFDIRFGMDAPNVIEGRRLTFSGARMSVADDAEPVGFTYPDVGEPRVRILDNAPRTDAKKPVVLSITSAFPIRWNDVVFDLDNKRTAPDSFKDVAGGREYVFTNGGTAWSNGVHRLKTTVVDAEDYTNKADKVFFVGEDVKLPPVRLRDDGMTLVDGKPFFPIGIYGVAKRDFNAYDYDRAISDLKAAGFNTVQSYSSAGDKAYIAAVHKYGMRTFRTAGFGARNIDEFRHDPTTIAWYLDDDTSAHHLVSHLEDADDNVRATDTTRITCQADIVGPLMRPSAYTYYAHATDVFLPEVYPVWGKNPNRDKGCVAETIYYMKSYHDDNARVNDGRPRAVWPIIQFFKGYSLWKRMPTAAEMTAMSFAAVIHGAQGITWYTYGGYMYPERNKFDYGVTSSEETWRAMTNVTRRISALVPVLVERTGVQPPRSLIVSGPKKDAWLNDSISQLQKVHAGWTYLLTVNSTDQPVTARFRVKASGKIGVMNEGRSLVAASDGTFTDTFKPYEVHVYRFKGR